LVPIFGLAHGLIGAHVHFPLSTTAVEFSLNFSASTKWFPQTFPPIFGLFAIFDRNLAKIVAPPSDEYEIYVLNLIALEEQSIFLWQKNNFTGSQIFHFSHRKLTSPFL